MKQAIIEVLMFISLITGAFMVNIPLGIAAIFGCVLYIITP